MTDLMLSLADFKANPDLYTLIDVRAEAEFSERHIPDAMNIPMGRLQAGLHNIPAGRVPVTVCGKGGGRSADSAAKLRTLGLAAALWLEGGTIGWFRLCRSDLHTAPGSVL